MLNKSAQNGVANLPSYRLAPGFVSASDVKRQENLYRLLAFLLTGGVAGSMAGSISLLSRQLASPKIRRRIRQYLESSSPGVDLDLYEAGRGSNREKKAFILPSVNALGPLLLLLGSYGSYNLWRDLLKWKVESDSSDVMLAAAKRYDESLRRLAREKLKAEKQASHQKRAVSLVDFYWSLVAATFGLAAVLTHIKTKNQGSTDVLEETLRSRTLQEFESSPPFVYADAPGAALSVEARKNKLL